MGRLLLINIMDYDNDPSLKRVGSDIDVNKLTDTFQTLGFKLYKDKVHINLMHIEMHRLIKEFAKDPINEKASCSAVVIMAHGFQQGLIRAHNHLTISIHTDVYPLFSNETAKALKGKPKLFLFQTCRGTNLTSQVDNAGDIGKRCLNKTMFSDMITIYPTFENYASVRKKEGSWFVDAFCKVFSNAEDTNSMEIRELLDKVTLPWLRLP